MAGAVRDFLRDDYCMGHMVEFAPTDSGLKLQTRSYSRLLLRGKQKKFTDRGKGSLAERANHTADRILTQAERIVNRPEVKGDLKSEIITLVHAKVVVAHSTEIEERLKALTKSLSGKSGGRPSRRHSRRRRPSTMGTQGIPTVSRVPRGIAPPPRVGGGFDEVVEVHTRTGLGHVAMLTEGERERQGAAKAIATTSRSSALSAGLDRFASRRFFMRDRAQRSEFENVVLAEIRKTNPGFMIDVDLDRVFEVVMDKTYLQVQLTGMEARFVKYRFKGNGGVDRAHTARDAGASRLAALRGALRSEDARVPFNERVGVSNK